MAADVVYEVQDPIDLLTAHPVLYRGVPCITLRMVDVLLEVSPGCAKMAHKRCRHRLTDGVHFYRITSSEWGRACPEILGKESYPRTLVTTGSGRRPSILLTQEGFHLLATAIESGRAWQVREGVIRRFMASYFDSNRTELARATDRGVAVVEPATKLEIAALHAVQMLSEKCEDGFVSVHERLDSCGATLEELVAAFNQVHPRADLSMDTKQQHVAVIERHYHGCCPIDGKTTLVRDGAKVSGEWEHHRLRSKAGPEHTWLVSLPSHKKLADQVERDRVEPIFQAFQAHRRAMFPVAQQMTLLPGADA